MFDFRSDVSAPIVLMTSRGRGRARYPKRLTSTAKRPGPPTTLQACSPGPVKGVDGATALPNPNSKPPTPSMPNPVTPLARNSHPSLTGARRKNVQRITVGQNTTPTLDPDQGVSPRNLHF